MRRNVPGRIPASLAGVGRLENMFFMAENGLTAAHQKAKSFCDISIQFPGLSPLGPSGKVLCLRC
ncbi:hypothetical protein FZ928_01910 [Klebsiella pneumoniae]|uniref:Uncharacterized protein n=1 Tax=Klebsiella pneumoniae TaxID=573 RepID=A0A5C2LL81_KLEPN|nr:hypothetical protein FZ928_01910 [Klebsiella pneumoniae]